ncbi:hypothetical protein M501DRAFT_1004069 [Patellaria atrata CBS 101060]|uniref:Uncharacterized protein n=1 Tax=Patellaria atrata CBS 101060 TaxID=1346257 RepID=A0A9P4SCU7_9PEZI|nr:hypothetical protein M501DRAFT_1004069 [Patellaria atrata CBS 101060]
MTADLEHGAPVFHVRLTLMSTLQFTEQLNPLLFVGILLVLGLFKPTINKHPDTV